MLCVPIDLAMRIQFWCVLVVQLSSAQNTGGPVFSEWLAATLLSEGPHVQRHSQRLLFGHCDSGGQWRLRRLHTGDRALLCAGSLRRLLVLSVRVRAEEAPGRRYTRAERGAKVRRVARAMPVDGAACAASAALRGHRLPRLRQLLLHLLERAGQD